MKTLNLNECKQVSGGAERTSDGATGGCILAAGFLMVSPFGGPWTVAGALIGAFNECLP